MDNLDNFRERFEALEQPTEPLPAAALHGRTVAVLGALPLARSSSNGPRARFGLASSSSGEDLLL